MYTINIFVTSEHSFRYLLLLCHKTLETTGCPIKKVSIKKLLVGPVHGFNSQFLNLFGFSISVIFVWCIIQ